MQGEIVEAHLEQEVEPRAELGEEVAGHRLVAPVEREVLDPRPGLRDREAADLADRPLAEAHRPRLGPQPVAGTGAAGSGRTGQGALRHFIALVLGDRAGLARGANPGRRCCGAGASGGRRVRKRERMPRARARFPGIAGTIRGAN